MTELLTQGLSNVLANLPTAATPQKQAKPGSTIPSAKAVQTPAAPRRVAERTLERAMEELTAERRKTNRHPWKNRTEKEEVLKFIARTAVGGKLSAPGSIPQDIYENARKLAATPEGMKKIRAYNLDFQKKQAADFVRVFGPAADEAGVPRTWLTDPYLWKVLNRESGSTPGDIHWWTRNIPVKGHKPSSAYGAFQFLDKTWQDFKYPKTADPYKQFVDGLKRIKSRYKEPKAAWKHEEDHGWH